MMNKEEIGNFADKVEDALDDIKGAANKKYYPFQDDESRLSHIASAVDELLEELGKLRAEL